MVLSLLAIWQRDGGRGFRALVTFLLLVAALGLCALPVPLESP